ncbi:hypothetical protein FACS189487_09160 [Campylobacterota bacterium]|nr:hypothetical protein FACS189487_09160 [Campylobacterota bacterium]
MINNHFRTFVAVFVFGFMLTINLYAQTDNRLNGNWISIINGVKQELRINKGNFEEIIDGIPYRKGTYSASNGKLTMESIQVHGKGINTALIQRGVNVKDFGIESKWYTLNEIASALKSALIKIGATEKEASEAVRSFSWQNNTTDYSVDTNTLTMFPEFRGKIITVTFSKNDL